ncbi:MAG: hypothetical protein O4803_05205 [Trichodesmium sp. St15_bin1_1]|jgi:hypothetical protein|nr:hypothetical protein [Trichodesmium sp. St18_bin1]MDE5088830.1 hypothetical protein [Trichodesmium sp. St16_bin2-tuft]MDE5107268.1 hypothetical protein [Trichodesmium sp. St17_bin3_1_1]MDE5113681.1 hypothetical protein [Trichodesmium sp. St15_bin1_1]
MTIKYIFKQRVIPIVDNLLTNYSLFQNLERDEIVKVIFDVLMRNSSPEELQEMTDKILRYRIRRILGGQVLFGLLSDLTSEEIEDFDAAVRDLRKI